MHEKVRGRKDKGKPNRSVSDRRKATFNHSVYIFALGSASHNSLMIG
jgi:hypothetical protein